MVPTYPTHALMMLMKSLECALCNQPFEEADLPSEERESLQNWGHQVAGELIRFNPELFMQTECVMCSVCEAFSSILRSANCHWLLKNLLSKPHNFARSLLLLIKLRGEHNPGSQAGAEHFDNTACRIKAKPAPISRLRH